MYHQVGLAWSRCGRHNFWRVKNVLIASPAIFDPDVCVRRCDYVHRFVSLLNLGPHTA